MKRQKIKEKPDKIRVNLYLDRLPVGEWVVEEAKKMGLNETSFTRMLITNAYNEKNNAR